MRLGLSRRLGIATSFMVLGGASSVSAATWQEVPPGTLGPASAERVLVGPHRVLRLDEERFAALVATAPAEGANRLSAPVLDLPWPDGGTRRFAIEVSPVMEAALAEKFPELQTYRGRGIDDPTAVARFDRTPAGVHVIVLSSEGTVYVDPWSPEDRQHYVSYFKRDYRRRDGTDFTCHFDASNPPDLAGNQGLAGPLGLTPRPRVFGEVLRTYRLALAANVEYTTFHGGTVPSAMAALVTAMNRVNGVYERDLAVHMNLVANNDLIVYTAEPDPYTNGSGFQMLGQNQANLDLAIGPASYDIGHVFSTGGGGQAVLGVVCTDGVKARGVTGQPQPTGDPFWIDYVAHEIGHQFRGNHTFNGTTGSCGNGNRNPPTAWEPGSGSTIMAYAGICGTENLQPHSDDLFHAGNLLEMQTFVSVQAGSSCPTSVPTGNAIPAIDGGVDHTIPQTTPFTLTASGADPDGEPLAYIWEQMDAGAASPPNTDDGTRAIFRSFNVSPSPARTFPRLPDVLSNSLSFGEAWPTTDRTLHFLVTARDNHPGAGGTSVDDVAITVSAAAGPFVVTSPNTAVTWTGNSAQTVTWDVANTLAPPIGATFVRLSLSTDGGLTFPTILTSFTFNDGSENILVPNTPTTQARIKVEALGNVFFDIGNADFTIVAGASPNASIADASMLEGDVGTVTTFFTVTLTSASGSPVTVDFATADGTATVGDNDYIARSGVVTFAPGQTAAGITVSAVGDLSIEPDETFFVNLSNLSGGGSITDAQAAGTIVNDDGGADVAELVHGYSGRRSLAATGGLERQDVYRLAQKPQSSYEVVTDETSGDLVPLALERVGSPGSTVLQTSQAAGTGPARSLRWQNTTSTEVADQAVRVRSGDCTTTCGPEDVYRVRAYETTLAIPRYNNSGSQVTILILQNPTDAAINATAYFWDGSGTLLAQQAYRLAGRSLQVVNTSDLVGAGGTSGAITVTHDGRYGELTGKTVALEPATGFSFDSPMMARPR